mgnify:CR=1 FL=1
MNKILQGDCLIKLKELEDNSVDSICTDPPYHLVSIVKRFGKENSAPAKFGTDGAFSRASKGFMGKDWDGVNEDGIGIAQKVELWKECLRVLKPGGHLLAFSGTRTYHRMASAIEDAGFDIRDQIAWCYGQGFPKSLNVFKQLKKKCECGNMEVYENRTQQVGANSEQEAEYFMRFMQETDLPQTKSIGEKQGEVLQSQMRSETLSGTLQDNKQGEEPKESSVRGEERILERGNNLQKTEGKLQGSNLSEMSEGISSNGEERRLHNATQISDGSALEPIIDEKGSGASHRPQPKQQQYKQPCAFCKQWGTQAIRTLGVGTALKPSIEPICVARKPIEKGLTVAENCLKYGTGGINIDESRVGTEEITTSNGDGFGTGGIYGTGINNNKGDTRIGRFPANLIHDNSDEVKECFPESKGGAFPKTHGSSGFVSPEEKESRLEMNDSGNASRFFKSIIYQAKASKSERNKGCEELEEKDSMKWAGGNEMKGLAGTYPDGTPRPKQIQQNNHPTVKPIALMTYLIKMVTPKGGVVLDPFAGSGSTLVAAKENGFQYIGIEMTPEYIPIIEARLKAVKKENTLF